ncbi:MAG: hypothetical protein U0744_07015 [Gemmataceae bacterium]
MAMPTGKLQLSGCSPGPPGYSSTSCILAVFENRVLVLFQWFWNYIT